MLLLIYTIFIFSWEYYGIGCDKIKQQFENNGKIRRTVYKVKDKNQYIEEELSNNVLLFSHSRLSQNL